MPAEKFSRYSRHDGEHMYSSEFAELEPIYEVFDYWSTHPVGNDGRVKAYAIAAKNLMHRDEKFREALSEMLADRWERGRPTTPLYAANLSLRSANHVLRHNLTRRQFAFLTQSASGWEQQMQRLLRNPELSLQYREINSWREVQTNVPDRYKGIQLYLALHSEKFRDEAVNVLDVGTSLGLGAKALIGGQLGGNITVQEVVPGVGVLPRSEWAEGKLPEPASWSNTVSISSRSSQFGIPKTRESISSYIREKLAMPIVFGPSLGVDMMNPGDDAQREWVKSCYYPSEIAENKGHMMSKFNKLSKLNLNGIWYPVRNIIDFTYKVDAERVGSKASELGIDRFHLISFVTVLSQLHERERAAMINNAIPLLKPGGKIIVQDFARPNPQKPSGLEFYDLWHPYTYRTMVIDPAEKDGEPQEFFWWDSGRCKCVIIAPTANTFISQSVLDEISTEFT